MTARTLVDTGPLVALLNRRDRFHEWAVAQLAAAKPPLLTCEAVLSEACFLLRELEPGPTAVIELVERGLLALPLRLAAEASRIKELLSHYGDQPMSLADACLVRLSELNRECRVLTVDQDFLIYRRNGRQVIPTIMPA